MWDLLRARRLAGLKFRRQQPLGPYVVDFYCEEAALVVEADGPIHYQRRAYDRARDTFLEKAGLAVLRFTNEQILAKPRSVLRRIAGVAEPRSSRVSPPFSLRGRVAPPSLPGGAPTDPDVRNSRIRLFGTWIRYARRGSSGRGSGYRSNNRYIISQESPRWERRRKPRHHCRTAECRNRQSRVLLPLRPK